MSRIRTVKPDFFKHEGLYDAERETGLPLRIAFAGLWTVCDREGRFAWRPRAIKTDALPYDEVDFSRVLDALATRGFVVRYASQGQEYGYIPSWHKHQVINNREAASAIPDPSECIEQSDASGTRDPRVTEMHVHAQGEGKGKEGEGDTLTGREDAPDEFSEKAVFAFGKTLLGRSSGGVIVKLVRHHVGDLRKVKHSLHLASTKENPMEYVQAILRQPADDDWRAGAA